MMQSISAATVKLSNGLAMPVLGLGTWLSGQSEVKDAVKHALKIGYMHIDCAAVYGNEKEVGRGIAEAVSEGLLESRSKLWVTSKLWITNLSPQQVKPALQKTLQDLGLSYLDQYLIHWPVAFQSGDDQFPKDKSGNFVIDQSLDIRDTWKQLEACVSDGLTRSIGVSNFSEEDIQKILEMCTIRPVVNQIECHPYLRQDRLRKFMNNNNIYTVAYGPLGSKGFTAVEEPALQDRIILKIAEEKGKTAAQIILRWGLQTKSIVIPKSVTPSRIEENANIFDFELSSDDVKRINAITIQKRNVNPNFGPHGAPFFPPLDDSKSPPCV